MVLILNGIAALLIRIKSIKLLGGQTWVDDPTYPAQLGQKAICQSQSSAIA